MLRNILNHEAVKSLIKKTFQGKEIEILDRPQSFIIRCKKEEKDFVTRIIILPPHGYTSNSLDELNPHDEVRKAKVIVKGSLRDNKKNFSLIKNCLIFYCLTKREAVVERSVPYALVSDNKKLYKEKLLSSRDTLYVVKENGEGFYHNLINKTGETLVLLLKKELRSGKQMNIEKKVKELKLSIPQRKIIFELFKKIKKHGDNVFSKDCGLIEKVMGIKNSNLMPILIEGLNIYETGRHEPCTVYAFIIKKSKSDKVETLKYLNNAIKKNLAPLYYLKELIGKIDI